MGDDPRGAAGWPISLPLRSVRAPEALGRASGALLSSKRCARFVQNRAELVVVAEGEESTEREVDDRALTDALNVREFAQSLVEICVHVGRELADRRRGIG